MKRLATIVMMLFASISYAQKSTTLPAAVAAEDFTCGKMQGGTLVEFKTQLVDSCDLNKPFSSSLSAVLNEINFFYCCHKRK